MTRKNPTAQRGRCGALADEWEAISKRRGMSDNESYRAGDRQAAIEIELIATPAKTMTDIIAKARILKEWERQRVTSSMRISFSRGACSPTWSAWRDSKTTSADTGPAPAGLFVDHETSRISLHHPARAWASHSRAAHAE